MKIEDLVGFQLVTIADDQIVVSKDGEIYTLLIDQDEGDCCGFNDVKTELLISDDDLANNPVIMGVKIEKNDDSNDNDIGYYDGDRCKITFFGLYKPLALLESESNSGSGWCYGATVSLKCKPLNLDEIVTEW